MVDQRTEKLAKLCVHYSVNVKPKETVMIQGSDQAFPLIHELYKECLLANAYPTIMPSLDVQYTFFKYAKDNQIKYVSPVDRFIMENFDVFISIFCQPNPKRLTSISASKIRTWFSSLKELNDVYFRREAEGKVRGMVLPYPINAQALEAGMALPEYEDFVYNSCLVNRRDPKAEWTKIRKEQDKVCKFLSEASKIRVVGEDTDLTFNVKGRKWINCYGDKNMPDGEVFTGPIENSAEGTVRFNFPGLYAGREIEDIRLWFKRGKVVKASASKGEDLLKGLLKVEGANRLGETAIGTNYSIARFTKNMLFDEKMGGTVHIALGMSIPESGGVNKSAVHWDILKNMRKDGEIYADGELFYKNGKFLKP